MPFNRYNLIILVGLFSCFCSRGGQIESACKQVISELTQTKIIAWGSFEILDKAERGDSLWCLVRAKYIAQNYFGAEIKQDNLVCFIIYGGKVIYSPTYSIQSASA
jgi:hypothetical protein